MRINIVTLFPEFFTGTLACGLMQRAQDSGIIAFSLRSPRDVATDKHHSVDDRPYGGSPGMVMLPGPLATTLQELGFSSRCAGGKNIDSPRAEGECSSKNCADVKKNTGRLIFLAPKGRPLTQKLAQELAKEKELTLICGRYEGMDARIEELFPVECVSVGDFVLNGGEAAALCLVESVGRLLPGFMGHEDSGDDESFSHGLLEYPHYTRPEEFGGLAVPQVLRSGAHARIAKWRRESALATTLANRPDMLSNAPLSEGDREFLREKTVCRVGRNLYCALVHYPVLDKQKNSIAVSLTNFDIHDIARSSYSYGMGGYYVLTPLEDQRRLLSEILAHWTQGPGKISNPDRDEALASVKGLALVEDAIVDITQRTGQKPLVIGTSANPDGAGVVAGFTAIQEALGTQPVLLLFGTGHGLAPQVNELCDAFLPPLRWHGGYNHLSVRAAAAIIFDRILGDWR